MLKCGMVTKRLEGGEGKEEVEEERGRGGERAVVVLGGLAVLCGMRVMRACICLMRAKTLADFLKKIRLDKEKSPGFRHR